MVILNTVNVDGVIVDTVWDPNHIGPVELHIRIDENVFPPTNKGITQRFVHELSLQSMAPEETKTLGSLRDVGDWLERNKPALRNRPENPELFYSCVALFFVLAVESGHQGVTSIMGNYAAIRPSMAREWIQTARRLRLLTENRGKCRTGRAYGTLTDKARTILASQSVSKPEAA